MLVRCVNLRLFTRFDRGLRFPWKNKQTKTKQAWPQKSFSTTQKQPLDGITTLNYRNSPGVLSIMVYTEDKEISHQSILTVKVPTLYKS